VLVLIHGFGDSASGWSQVVAALAEDYRVVALDLPGHGASGPNAPPLGFDDLEAGLEAALEDQGDRLILLGNSLGGWLATLFALDHPTRVQRLLLLNAGGASWAQLDEQLLLPETRDRQRAKNRAVMGVKAPPVPDSSSIS
jgi:pimeloyl-ACP methyl ester carboxylesterase